MYFEMQSGSMSSDVQLPAIDAYFYSEPLDERGRCAADRLSDSGAQGYRVEYFPDSFELVVDGDRVAADDIDGYMAKFAGKIIAIEATTCGFAEIMLITQGLTANDAPAIVYLYLEPGLYSQFSSRHLFEKRAFTLSELSKGYRAIPGSVLTIRPDDQLVFFLGYENHRLRQAFEAHQTMNPQNAELVFGVPGFQVGWEMNAFANHIQYIHDERMSQAIHFCGANNPESAFDVLTHIRRALGPNQRLHIAPIGTKPFGIGAALFAATHNSGDVGILYDHPKRKPDRSAQVHRWNLYIAKFFSTMEQG